MKFWKAIGVIDRYDWTFTWWGFLAELQRQPLLVGTDWYDDMMSTDADGLVTTRGGANPGGHEYLASEIQWDQRLIGFEQSWGEHPPGFGIDGRFWMRWGLAKQLIVKQRGDVCVPRWL